MAGSISMEAHAMVLREELSQLDADLALLTELQMRYSDVIPAAQSAGGKSMTRCGGAAGNRSTSGSAMTPTTAADATAAPRPLLTDALQALRDTRESKSTQLSNVVSQQAATDDALRRAAALVDELRYRDIPVMSSGSHGVGVASPARHAQSGAVHQYRPSHEVAAHDPAVRFAPRPIMAPSSPAPMSVERHAVAPPAQIGFDPPLAVGGWRSYLRGPSPHSTAEGVLNTTAGAEQSAYAATPSAVSHNGPRAMSFASTPMLVVLPPGSQTNLSTGLTPSHRR